MGQIYLHPAALILAAYIFPMSPIPMIPTEGCSIISEGRLKLESIWKTQPWNERKIP